MFASKYNAAEIQRPDWNPERMRLVKKEDDDFYETYYNPMKQSSKEWKIQIFKHHCAPSDMIEATAKKWGISTDHCRLILDQINRTIAITQSRRFHGEGHPLPILNGAPLGMEIIDLIKLPEVQKMKIKLPCGNQSRVEDMLFMREVFEGSLKKLDGDE